jgi:phage tail protein X
VIWTLVELPWETGSDTSPTQIAALLGSACLVAAVARRMLKGIRWAHYAFMLICMSSIIALAPGLRDEYGIFPAGFVLSAVECVLKLLALTVMGLGGPGIGRTDTGRPPRLLGARPLTYLSRWR